MINTSMTMVTTTTVALKMDTISIIVIITTIRQKLQLIISIIGNHTVDWTRRSSCTCAIIGKFMIWMQMKTSV